MKKLITAILLVVALVWGAWLVAIPEEVIVSAAEKALRRGDMGARLMGFRKGLFYSFTSEEVEFISSGERIGGVREVSGRLDFPSFFMFRAVVPFRGVAGGGEIRGKVALSRKSRVLTLKVEGVELAKLGLYPLAGLRGSGSLTGDMRLVDGKGKAVFRVEEARLEPLSAYGVKLPLDMFRDIRGALYIEGDTLTVESLALEGEGIYARVKGKIKGNEMDLRLELMPDNDTFPDPLFNEFLRPYRLSRGHYVIPFKERSEGY